MKILLLLKRQYMRKDVIDDRFWKFWEFPKELARNGNEVTAVCLSYRSAQEGPLRIPDSPVAWHSINAGALKIPGLMKYIRYVLQLAEHTRPDVIIGASDSIYGIAGNWVAKRVGCKFVFDLYDDFDGFAACRVPFVRRMYHEALEQSDGVVLFSDTLRERLDHQGLLRHGSITIPAAVDRSIFRPMPRAECREALRLPTDVPIIGTAGTITAEKNYPVLFEAFAELQREIPSLQLALAGPLGRGIDLPKHGAVHYFGPIAHAEVPRFINALDLVVVTYRDGINGAVCYPTRAMEAMACGVPVVCPDLGDFRHLLQSFSANLYRWDSREDLCRVISEQLRAPEPVAIPILNWSEYCTRYVEFIRDACERG